jgi:hypothetical protein
MWLPSWLYRQESGSAHRAGRADSPTSEFDGLATAPECVIALVEAMMLGELLPASRRRNRGPRPFYGCSHGAHRGRQS